MDLGTGITISVGIVTMVGGTLTIVMRVIPKKEVKVVTHDKCETVKRLEEDVKKLSEEKTDLKTEVYKQKDNIAVQEKDIELLKQETGHQNKAIDEVKAEIKSLSDKIDDNQTQLITLLTK